MNYLRWDNNIKVGVLFSYKLHPHCTMVRSAHLKSKSYFSKIFCLIRKYFESFLQAWFNFSADKGSGAVNRTSQKCVRVWSTYEKWMCGCSLLICNNCLIDWWNFDYARFIPNMMPQSCIHTMRDSHIAGKKSIGKYHERLR